MAAEFLKTIPETRGRKPSGYWPEALKPLRKRQGFWKLLGTYSTTVQASNTAARLRKSYGPEYEFSNRGIDMYGRFTGKRRKS